MVSTVHNTEVKQKDAERAVVVAIAAHAVFDLGTEKGAGVFGPGVAFPLLQALQRVNERLLEGNPSESLLFDVVLVTTDIQQQQQSERMLSSTKHHGLEVGRFCFTSREDFIEGLLKNNVALFLSTDNSEVSQTTPKGVFSALLDERIASSPTEQLRVLFCGDAIIREKASLTPSSGHAAQSFLTQLGELRGKFSVLDDDSPLSIAMVTSQSGRESCGSALLKLRSFRVNVDKAYCLAGAPRAPILSLFRPHFLLSDGFSRPQD